MDHDTADVFGATVQFAVESGIDLPRFAVLTPFPGTPLYHRLHQQGRIINDDWELYDGQHVVFQPQNMTAQQLAEGHERAWPLADFEGGRVIHDRVGDLDVVLIGDEATRTVRAYRAEGRRFAGGPAAGVIESGGEPWRVEESALIGPGGERLERLPGHVGYWFAWQSFVDGAPLAGTGPR